jgi:carbamoyltransferase
MLHLADYAQRQTGSQKLCLSGGVGLNSVANWRLTQEGPFEEIFVHPACSDSGIPMGAALYGYYEILNGEIPWHMEHAYMGRSYSQEEIDAAIAQFDGFQVIRGDILPKTAELLAEGRCVGWFDGASEYGPRALGHRSILVDPTKAENKDRLNARVKFREAFRPFAPIVPWEHAQEYFELDRPAPFMLLVPKVVAGKEAEIPAVTHVDGSARVQTIARETNPRMHALLMAFKERTGVPVLLNTSFNVAGEPIVESPVDTIRCFTRTAIDALVLSDTLLIKDEYV